MDVKTVTLIALVIFSVFLVSKASGDDAYNQDYHWGRNSDPYADEASGVDEDEFGSGSGGDDSDRNRLFSPYILPVTPSPVDYFSSDRSTTPEIIINPVVRDDEDDEAEAGHAGINLHLVVITAIIVGGVLLIVLVVLLIMFVVYRMRKRDEGSYVLDDPTMLIINSADHHHGNKQQQHRSLMYAKAPPNDLEFYA